MIVVRSIVSCQGQSANEFFDKCGHVMMDMDKITHATQAKVWKEKGNKSDWYESRWFHKKLSLKNWFETFLFFAANEKRQI